MVITCVVYGCNSKSIKGDSSLNFHRFPFSHPEILEQWVEAVQREEGWWPTNCSRVCSRHFGEDSYQIRPGAQTKRLREVAVPYILLGNEEETQQRQSTLRKRKSRRTKSVNEDDEPHQTQNIEQMKTQSVPIAPNEETQTSECRTTAAIIVPNDHDYPCLNTPLTSSNRQQRQNVSGQKMPKKISDPVKVELRRKIKVLREQVRRRDERISQLKLLVDYLKLSTANKEDSVKEFLTNHFAGFALELVLNQYKNQNLTKFQMNYSSAIKEFALNVFFHSPKAYNYIRSRLHLPHPSRLKNWLSSKNCKPGFIIEGEVDDDEEAENEEQEPEGEEEQQQQMEEKGQEEKQEQDDGDDEEEGEEVEDADVAEEEEEEEDELLISLAVQSIQGDIVIQQMI